MKETGLRIWRIGDWQVAWEEGGLRYLTWRGTEIARGIYGAVRDRDWGTVLPRIRDMTVEESANGLVLRFASEHIRDEIDFAWQGTITISPRHLRFAFDGEARSSFLRNRIGLCVLHPMEHAGMPVRVETVSGTTVNGSFPEAISPYQPFKDIQALEYEPAPGISMRMTFCGERFEMEDQRNWTDASFKTYCTPLDLPFPVKVEAGERISQYVDILITSDSQTSRIEAMESTIAAPVLSLSSEKIGRLPDFGLVFPGGFLNDVELSKLREVGVSYLRFTLDMTEPDWESSLQEVFRAVEQLNCELELETIAAEEQSMRDLLRLLVERQVPVRRVIPYGSGKFVTEHGMIAACREAGSTYGLPLEIGGGTRANYAELNRAQLPLDAMDFAVYSMNPQVHAFDDRSIMETIDAQVATALDAMNKTGKPLYLGPITLKPRLNPAATSGRAISIEEQRDDRLDRPFVAAWTLGSMAALSVPGVKGLSYFATHGPLGLVDGTSVRPMFDIFKAVSEYRDAEIIRIDGIPKSIAAMGFIKEQQRRICLANLTCNPVQLKLALDSPYPIRIAKETLQPQESEIYSSHRGLYVELAPYGYAVIDIVEERG